MAFAAATAMAAIITITEHAAPHHASKQAMATRSDFRDVEAYREWRGDFYASLHALSPDGIRSHRRPQRSPSAIADAPPRTRSIRAIKISLRHDDYSSSEFSSRLPPRHGAQYRRHWPRKVAYRLLFANRSSSDFFASRVGDYY